MTEKKHIDVSVIEAYVEGSISLKQASIMLERTPRTIMRLAAKYRDFGADGLSMAIPVRNLTTRSTHLHAKRSLE